MKKEATEDDFNDRFTNILLVGKRRNYIETACHEILHRIALRVGECSISVFVRDQTEFDDFLRGGSMHTM